MIAEKENTGIQQIGRYHVTGELGRGGMGIVYRAEDRLIGREVAVKTLTEVTPELRERFYIEARSGILSHPNIVTVYEMGEHEGVPFIAMELIQGESLEKILRVRKRLPLLEALSIVEQLCAGLGYAHARGVLHRDIKPANVLVQLDGRVTLVDFGIARLSDQTQKLTKTDMLLGTFHYIAPERLKGDPSDGRADVWSVGIMLYEMLTGELPFRGKDISSIYRVIHEPHVPANEHVQDLPEGLSKVLDRALAKDVDERYSTAEEMIFDLQLITEGMKQDRLNGLLETARRLADEGEFASARSVLLQAQRIDPGNTDAKLLISEVQEQLGQLQRGEQLRQLVEQAEVATTERRWEDASALLEHAQKLDSEKSHGIEERLKQVQDLKSRQREVVSLWEQAQRWRSRGDLQGARKLLKQALDLDENNADLKKAYEAVLREEEQADRAQQAGRLIKDAQSAMERQLYTQAIQRLHEAAGLEPENEQIQTMFKAASADQEQARHQQLLQRVAAEIKESITQGNFELAKSRLARALEILPGEAPLLHLQQEADALQKERDANQSSNEAAPQESDSTKSEEDVTRTHSHAEIRQALSARAEQAARPDEDKSSALTQGKKSKPAAASRIAESKAAEAVVPQQQRITPPAKSAPAQKSGRGLLYAGGALALAAVAAAGATLFRSSRHAVEPPPAPHAAPAPVATVEMEINASPWGRVLRVEGEKSGTFLLPEGDNATPLRIEGVVPGSYTVTVADGDGQQHQMNCEVSAQQHLCTVAFSEPDVQSLLKGDQQ